MIGSFQPDAADRQRVRDRDDEGAARAVHILGVRIARQRDVKTLLEAAAELAIVFAEAITGLFAPRIDLAQCDALARQCGSNQIHRRQQRLALRMLREEALGLRVRQRLVGRELAPAGTRQRRDAPARVVLMRIGLDQPFVLEAAEQPTHQAGVEAEIVADLGHVRTSVPDRVEHARRPQRPPASQE